MSSQPKVSGSILVIAGAGLCLSLSEDVAASWAKRNHNLELSTFREAVNKGAVKIDNQTMEGLVAQQNPFGNDFGNTFKNQWKNELPS